MENHCESRRSLYQILVVSRDDVNIKSAHIVAYECQRFRRDGTDVRKRSKDYDNDHSKRLLSMGEEAKHCTPKGVNTSW